MYFILLLNILIPQIQSQVQWDGHYGTINTVTQLKHELAYKQPAAFQPAAPSSQPAAIGPSATPSNSYTASSAVSSNGNGVPPPPPPLPSVSAVSAPVVAHYALPPAPVYVVPTALPTAPAPVPPPAVPVPVGFQMAPPPPPPVFPLAATGTGTSAYSVNDLNNNAGATLSGEPKAKRARVEAVEKGEFLVFDVVNVARSQMLLTHFVFVLCLSHSHTLLTVLVPAEEFTARYNGAAVTISLQLPVADGAYPANWNLQGQLVSVNLPVTSTIKQLKEAVGAEHLGGMPMSKQQMKDCTSGLGFLKDASTLAELNLGDGTVLELTVKSRGGKR